MTTSKQSSINSKAGKHKPKQLKHAASLPPRLNEHSDIKDFDAEILPSNTMKCVIALASLSAAPIVFALALFLTIISALLANFYIIRPNRKNKTYKISPNLSSIIVAKAGGKKSPVILNAINPLQQKITTFLRLFEKNFQHEVAEYKVKEHLAELHEAKVKYLLKQSVEIAESDPDYAEELKQEAIYIQSKLCNKELAPTPLCTIVTDTTMMGLVQTQAKQATPIILLQDEIAQLLERVDSSNSTSAVLRAYLLEAMDGNKEIYTAFRGTKQEKINIERNIISITGATQPSRIQKFIDGVLTGKTAYDGFYNRFGLWANMPSKFKFDSNSVDEKEDKKSYELYSEIISYLYFKSPLAPKKAKPRKPIFMTDDAENHFKGFKKHLESIIEQKTSEILISQLQKIEKTVLSSALVFEVIEKYHFIKSENIKYASITISLDSLKAGISVARYYTKSFQSIWGITDLKFIYANVIIDHWNKLENVFTARDVYQNNWTSIGRDKDKTKIALDLLLEQGYIKKLTNSNPNGGRTTIRYKKIK